jgi:diguanylate cyclase (GGDEF)-like protein
VFTFRTSLAATVLVAAVALPATASAATSVDLDEVGEMAATGVDLLTEEQALLDAADDRSPADADARLDGVDRAGATLLVQLDHLGVQLTDASRTALGRLPEGSDGFAPPSVVYDAAITDLARIAVTPAAGLPQEGRSSGPALGLLAVAAVSLLVLGAAALGNSLRRRESDAELAALAWSDGLTGLFNRRRLDHDVAAHDRGDLPVAVIMIDVDHFKSVNDTFGHQEGDDVLRRVASMLSDHVRYDDVVYRYGGEEFCVILPGATDQDAVRVAERIVGAAREILLPDGSNLTVSVGVAHDDDASATKACESADRALLSAKSGGRDRLVDASTIELTTTPA